MFSRPQTIAFYGWNLAVTTTAGEFLRCRNRNELWAVENSLGTLNGVGLWRQNKVRH